LKQKRTRNSWSVWCFSA